MLAPVETELGRAARLIERGQRSISRSSSVVSTLSPFRTSSESKEARGRPSAREEVWQLERTARERPITLSQALSQRTSLRLICICLSRNVARRGRRALEAGQLGGASSSQPNTKQISRLELLVLQNKKLIRQYKTPCYSRKDLSPRSLASPLATAPRSRSLKQWLRPCALLHHLRSSRPCAPPASRSSRSRRPAPPAPTATTPTPPTTPRGASRLPVRCREPTADPGAPRAASRWTSRLPCSDP